MPPIPYDLSSLNGVTFNADQIAYGDGAAYLAGAGAQVDPGNTDTSTGTVAIEYIDSTEHQTSSYSTFTVTLDNQTYTAGFTANGHTYLPTFGKITLDNGLGGGVHVEYIHGFASDGTGLLISDSTKLGFEYSSYDRSTNNGVYHETFDTPVGSSSFGILSNSDLGAGPNSPANAQFAHTGENNGYRNSYVDPDGVYHYQYDSYDTGTQKYVKNNLSSAPDGNPNPPSVPLIFTNDGSTFVAPCYAEGSRILTARGEVAVEDLIVGDEALLASGGTRPVIWIGSRRVRCDNHPRPHEVNPVRIKAGAFGEGLPVRDLVVSPGHALYVDGVLIPAHSLVNGATIVQEAVEKVRYFHIELDAHDVILAESLPCESYLDDGNRQTFGNAMEYTALHGRLDPMSWDQACAPMVAAGPQLTSVQARLHDRALAMGWARSEEPNLCLLADGVAIAPVMAKANRYWFAVPACSDLVLNSNASILAQVMPGLPDTRQLGVAVSDLKLDGQSLDLTQAFAHGAHDLETHGVQAWRWTNGAAGLSATLAEPAMVEITVLMVAPTWQRQVPALRLVQAG
jgi:hypothetical protein